MRAILIDPKLQRVVDIELSERHMLREMHRIIGADTLGHSIISDKRDELWCDDLILARGNPCFGFKLGPRDQQVILAGICVVVGNDAGGNSREPFIPIEMIQNDIDWLGEIIPEVIWTRAPVLRNGKEWVEHQATVTYSRVK